MSDAELLSQLRQERELMMLHWRDTGNSMAKCILGLLTAIGGFTYFYFKGEWGTFAIPREWMLFALIQFAFLSFLVVVSQFGAGCAYDGYIRALEERINSLTDKPTAVWASGFWKRVAATPHGAFFWCWVVIDAVVTVAILGVMAMFIMSSGVTWMKVLTILELPIGLSLILWARIDLDRSEKFSRSLLLGERQTKK